ncbi:MAG: FAD-dependent oxidoreductase [Chloroflexota bacterium]|nr:FAD-dependent oxidoreductase [Dehalococcoidia bacterium]MDW8254402.1 FAD-dependent oxidoreductase [Chloroflexota bacterium]
MTMTTLRPETAAAEGFQPDIIAVGAGTAGLILAYSAAEAGARVLLLEKTNRVGGTLYVSSGMFSAGGTRRQRERGIDDSPDEHFADILRISRNTVNRELVRRYVDLAPAFVDWLQDNGFEFEESCPVIIYGHEPYSKPRTYWGAENGRSLLKLLNRLLEPHFASGRVRVVFNAPAERLVMEGDRVVGVVAAGRDYRAPAVVLTTGGYSSSPELFARFTGGRRLVSIGNPASTGDGLLLGEAVGAQLVGSEYFLPTFGGIEDPDHPGRVYTSAPDEWDITARLVPQTRMPWEVWVNQRGERFIREDEESVDNRERALLHQPDMRFWVVFDDRILEESPPLILRWPAPEIRAKAKEGRLVLAADTIDRLAAKMDVPAATLQATIDAYNAALAAGAPDPLGRQHRPLPIVQPPFYAIKQQGIVLRTWTGLRADRDLRILRPDGTPIAGLYGVGEVLGAATFSGDSFCGGMSIGPALVFGRELGQRLARQVAAAA